MIFTDLGVVTTTAQDRPGAHAHHAHRAGRGKPDVIVFELGDGILGTYGVDAILECEDIRAALTGVVLSANDPVAAWGGVKLLRERFGIEPCVVTGPATDNSVGVEIIEKQLKVPAFNAHQQRRRAGRSRDRSGRPDEARALRPRGERASMTQRRKIPAIVLGGTGYVAGELLRLIAGHPNFELAGVMSDSQPGESVARRFRISRPCYGDTTFKSQEEIER